jgi:hypothetical protein
MPALISKCSPSGKPMRASGLTNAYCESADCFAASIA